MCLDWALQVETLYKSTIFSYGVFESSFKQLQFELQKIFCIGKENSALSDEIQLASNIKRENETLCFVFLI